MDKIEQTYNYYLNKFTQTNKLEDKKNYEIIITSFHQICKNKNPYIYDILYSNRDFEKYCNLQLDKRTQELQNILNNNKDQLTNIFNEYLDIPKTDTNQPTLTIADDFYNIVVNFLATINPQLCLLLNDLIDKKNIILTNDSSYGEELYDKSENIIYIIMGNNKSVDNMIILVHELGHAYYDYIYHEYHDTDSANKILKKEIPSQTLELLFIKYLIENDIYKEETIQYLTNFNDRLRKESLTVLQRLKEKSTPKHNITSEFAYAIGKLIAYYSVVNNISYDEILNYIHINNIEKLINLINDNKDIIINTNINSKNKVKHR